MASVCLVRSLSGYVPFSISSTVGSLRMWLTDRQRDRQTPLSCVWDLHSSQNCHGRSRGFDVSRLAAWLAILPAGIFRIPNVRLLHTYLPKLPGTDLEDVEREKKSPFILTFFIMSKALL